ncbi:hypothetical protein LA080_015191 [Diaporthe eres]|nr:hypothetical protein LA080_015191 [Diaporthe eres]
MGSASAPDAIGMKLFCKSPTDKDLIMMCFNYIHADGVTSSMNLVSFQKGGADCSGIDLSVNKCISILSGPRPTEVAWCLMRFPAICRLDPLDTPKPRFDHTLICQKSRIIRATGMVEQFKCSTPYKDIV